MTQFLRGAVALPVGAAALCSASPAAAQLRYRVISMEQCDGTAQRIARDIYNRRKLRLDQQNYESLRRGIRPAPYLQALADLDRWQMSQARQIAIACRGFRPAPNRPWTYEYAE